jgi:molecular chaperone GrpE
MEEEKEENIENIELTIEERLNESEDKYLRLYAEFENYKKRINKQKEDLVLETKSKMLSSILDMDSDISIAFKTIENEDAKKGVSLIASKLENFLKSQGIESIQTEIYDADEHEVISVLDIGESKIIDVASKGYSINGKIFRYPKIVLGK